MKNKRVLFLIESIKSRGRERQFVELLSYLKNKPGYELQVILMNKEIHYKKFLNLGVPYHVISRKWGKKDPSVFYKFFSAINRFRPDILHAWGNMVAIYSIPYKIFKKTTLINFQIQTAPQIVNNNILSHRLTFPFSDIIVANSAAGLRAFKAPENKSVVIFNGFSFERINKLRSPNEVKKRFRINTKFVVGMVAAFHETKDYKCFINAANNVLNYRRDITFIGVGSGDRSEYIKMIHRDNREHIILLEAQQDVESIMNVCDVGVLSTFTEGISNSIVEFMALGKPVIATDGGGTKEIVIHGKTGFLITREDPNELSGKILFLLNNPELRKDMGLNGKKRIQRSFSLDAMGRSFDKLHDSIMHK